MTVEMDAWAEVDDIEAGDAEADTDDPEVRKGHLRSLIARGGVTGQLASEALVAMEEREAKTERERLATVADQAAASEFDGWDPAELATVLTARAHEDRAEADRTYLAQRERMLRAEFGAAEATARIEAERLAVEATNALFPPEPSDVSAYHAFRREKAEHARAAEYAEDRIVAFRSIEADAAEAAEYVRDALALASLGNE